MFYLYETQKRGCGIKYYNGDEITACCQIFCLFCQLWLCTPKSHINYVSLYEKPIGLLFYVMHKSHMHFDAYASIYVLRQLFYCYVDLKN